MENLLEIHQLADYHQRLRRTDQLAVFVAIGLDSLQSCLAMLANFTLLRCRQKDLQQYYSSSMH